MNVIEKAIEMAMQEYYKENGDDVTLEKGEEFATVFNDGVLIIGLEDSGIKIKFLLGEPYKIDFNLGMTEKVGEE